MTRRPILLASILLLFCAGLLTGRPQQEEPDGKRLIDIKAGVMYPIKIADSTAICLTGDVVFYHNGAVISCDSAVRYSDKRMECFRNVIINKDSTYIYGDRADYNGEINMATVYSPLIKIMDGDAVMYTYEFQFNTLDNIGHFAGGGVLYQGDNVMEAERGYYYSSSRQVVCVQNVEIRNSEYRMKSDSIVYDMNANVAEFFTRSYMWNNQNDILSANRGTYDRQSAICNFTSDAYVLSAYRELWTDTLQYDNRQSNAEARSNVQILESEQKSMAFGDFARYTGARGETILTMDPSVLNYDRRQNGGDTLFMRADTIYMFVIYPSDTRDSLKSAAEEAVDRLAHLRWIDTLDTARRISLADSIRTEYQALQHVSDSLKAASDSIVAEILALITPDKSEDSLRVDSLPSPHAATDSIAADMTALADSTTVAAADTARVTEPPVPDTDSLTPAYVKQWRLLADSIGRIADSLQTVESYLRKVQTIAEPPVVAADTSAAADSVKADSTKILTPKQLKKLEKEKRRQQRMEAKRLKREQKQAKRRERLARRGIEYDMPVKADSTLLDSIPPILSDSLLNISAPEPATENTDTISRIIRGWHNVKMFRNDMQAVADSMVIFSVDSTMHLYIEPIIWSGENQITSEVVDMYTASQALDRAEFTGNPIMSSRLDSIHYNQVAGKTMLARFRNGEIVRNDVNGNAQAIYYLQEDGDPALLGLLVITCSNMTFEFEDKFISYITPRVSLDWHMYPMDKIPADQQLIFSWFKWQADRRPSKQDVFTRTDIRESRREEYEKIRQPRFPVSKKIDARRKRLVDSGIWADRTDPLPEHAIDYIRTLSASEQQ